MANSLRNTLLVLVVFFGCSMMAQGQQVLFKRYIQATGFDPSNQIPVSSDDAEQENNAMDDLEDDDLDAGWEGEAQDQNLLTTGMRFRDMFIPKGAVIDSAYIYLASHEAKGVNDTAKLTIYGEAADFAATYDLNTLITDRTYTAASVEWTVAEEWAIYQIYQTPDIKDIIQEIIDRPGWEVGNPINLILTGEDQGLTDTLENTREFEAFENIADPADGGDGQRHPERIPQLFVYYSFPTHFERFIQATGFDPSNQIEVSSDDAEQENDAMDDLEDDDIDAGWEGESQDQNLLTAGLRFRDIFIDQGTPIDSAFIYLASHEAKDSADVAEITIKVEDADSALTFDLNSLITDRPTINDTIQWVVDEPWFLYTEHRTPDLKDLVQAVINRPGWKNGNAISFIFEGNDQGITDTVENAREWEAFENIADPADGGDGRNHPERVARLRIYFDGATSVDYPVSFNALKVYPNPVSNEQLKVELPSSTAAEIRIYNINGQLMDTQSSKGGKLTSVDVRNLPAGSYFLRVEQDKQVFTQKVTVLAN